MITHCPTTYQEALVMHQERSVIESRGAYGAARRTYRLDPHCPAAARRMMDAWRRWRRAESTLANLRAMA